MTQSLLVSGGAGFIGVNFVNHWAQAHPDHTLVVLDALTYAGNRASLAPLEGSGRIEFVEGDICDSALVARVMNEYGTDTIVHFAAESHVDRSITGPDEFIRTNLQGTHVLLAAARNAWLSGSGCEHRFHHVSTDEVYGSLTLNDPPFTETTRYEPNSPYSASKAGSDHMVRAYHHTYGLQVTTSNCSNNYGPYHFPEKLIPHVILNALAGKPLPIYGDGSQIRDWLYVEDHAKALLKVIRTGKVGETYNIGGHNEQRNHEVVATICDLLEELAPNKPAGVINYKDLITCVADRPGHDQRYAIDAKKIQQELGWQPQETFESGIRKTVAWYLANQNWCKRILTGEYRLERLGEVS